MKIQSLYHCIGWLTGYLLAATMLVYSVCCFHFCLIAVDWHVQTWRVCKSGGEILTISAGKASRRDWLQVILICKTENHWATRMWVVFIADCLLDVWSRTHEYSVKNPKESCGQIANHVHQNVPGWKRSLACKNWGPSPWVHPMWAKYWHLHCTT